MNSNVDHEEVNKFAALAARWWDRNSEFKPLHDINPLRLTILKSSAVALSKVSAF
jgi:2-polyprenyl-6-hydroxyphenyl methylase/3-demethylubiquinone-9 3-methyltransferase